MSSETPAEDLADLYENAPCGYVSVSPRGHIVKINRTLTQWLGLSADDLVSKSIHDLLSFGGKIAYETHLAPLLRLQGFVHEIALDLRNADGEKIPVIANAAERRRPDGGLQFIRLTIFKAVDRRKYEHNLLEAKLKAEAEAAAEQANAVLRDQFIAVLGHDLRNPLSALTAGIRIIRTRETLSENGEWVLNEMDASVERAHALINDVLDFARGQLGDGLKISREPDALLKPALDHIVEEIRAIHSNRTIEATLKIDHPVACDSQRISQLASNLLTNALDHGAQDKPVRIVARTSDADFTLFVANQGEPIAAEICDKLFQPFFRASAEKNKKGLGLGLFIVSEIAKAHDGAVAIASDDTETRITLTIPRTLRQHEN